MHAKTTLRVELNKDITLELTIIYKKKNIHNYDVDSVVFVDQYNPRLPIKTYDVPMPLYEYLTINSPIDIEEKIQDHLANFKNTDHE